MCREINRFVPYLIKYSKFYTRILLITRIRWFVPGNSLPILQKYFLFFTVLPAGYYCAMRCLIDLQLLIPPQQGMPPEPNQDSKVGFTKKHRAFLSFLNLRLTCFLSCQ